MTRDRLVWLLALVGLVLGAWWLSANTEWVDDDRPRPASGEARDNPVYAAEQLLRRLGMHVAHHEALDVMPPEGGRLLLLSSDWELVPARAEQIHQWVMRGGHLVLMQPSEWEDTPLASWVPVEEVFVKSAERRMPQPPEGAASSAASAAGRESDHAHLYRHARAELASTPPLWGDTDRVSACAGFLPEWMLRTKPGQVPTWTLALADGTRATKDVVAKQDQALRSLEDVANRHAKMVAAEQAGRVVDPTRAAAPAVQALRLAIGNGSVTVLNAASHLFFNASALDCEHPELLAAVLQAEPGATAWIYLDEKREALMSWLWHRGWIALLMGALAIAAALWRAAVRFGPRLAAAPRLRRSISEQVRGLGAYLQSGGREALLVAQQRALHEVATRVLPRYARLPLAERVHALAEATGLPADDLTTALNSRACTRAELPQRLQLLETARRRLHRTPDERPIP